MFKKIPFSWLQLVHKKSRFLITIIGVTFSVVLIFIQLGLRDGLFEDSVTIHKTLQADLVLIPSETDYFWSIYTRSFPLRIIYSISAINGVNSVNPFYLYFGNFKNSNNLVTKTIAICAFKPDKQAFNLLEVNQQINLLEQSDTFLFDRLSRGEFGSIISIVQKNGFANVDLVKRKIKIAGLFSLGGGIFSADGILITSDLNYSKIFNQPLEKVHMGLVKLEEGIDPKIIIKVIAAQLPKGLAVMTMEDFMNLEKRHWNKATPIGFIFNLLAFMGFIIGGIIVYQILYTQISDYLYAYATLKAIGYTNIYLVLTVLQESLLMSVLGYIPGLIMSILVDNLIKNGTRIPIYMTFNRAFIVLILTGFMCSISSIIAIFKLRTVDPAELF